MTTILPQEIREFAINTTESVDPWSPNTTYAVDDEAYYSDAIWVSAADVNIGNTPATGSLQWTKKGASNRWAWADEFIGTASSAPDELVLVITKEPRQLVLVLDNVTCTEAQVQICDGGVLVFDETETMLYRRPGSLTEFFTLNPDLKKQALFDMPYTNPDARIIIRLKNEGGTASLGNLIIGTRRKHGCTADFPQTRMLNIKGGTLDDYGNFWVPEILNSASVAFEVDIDPRRFNDEFEALLALQGRLVFVIGDDRDQPTFQAFSRFGTLNDIAMGKHTTSMNFKGVEKWQNL